MRTLIVVLSILCFAACVASAAWDMAPREFVPRDVQEPGRIVWFWADPLEPPDAGWAHGDYTATYVPFFHIDTYMAWGSRGHSYWSGTFAYDADGGYGNSWDDRLILPEISTVTAVEQTSWGRIKAEFRESDEGRGKARDPIYPVITFAYRNDTEPAYDYSYVQAESGRAYVNLNRGYDGVHPWGTTGFYLGNMNDPYNIRFRFVSDGAWSDQDGLYLSVGGAFMCDDIQVWDYYSGTVYFFDDAESGGLCTPGGPPAAGDYWHTIANNCKAWSDPTVWVNTSVDTPGFVPPGVQNWLRTPTVAISNAVSCTTYWVQQFFTPTVDNDFWTETVYMDGVGTQLHAWWGDQCDSGYTPCSHFLGGDDVTSLLPAAAMYHEWVYNTTDNGAGPDICGCAGITLDDIGFYGLEYMSEPAGWQRVRSLYK